MLIEKFTCMGEEVGRIRLEVGEGKPWSDYIAYKKFFLVEIKIIKKL